MGQYGGIPVLNDRLSYDKQRTKAFPFGEGGICEVRANDGRGIIKTSPTASGPPSP